MDIINVVKHSLFCRVVIWPFTVAPPDQRPPPNTLIRLFAFYYYKEGDLASYLYLKVAVMAALTNILFNAAYWYSYFAQTDLNILGVNIPYNHELPIEAYLYEFPQQAVPLIIIITIFYTLFLFSFKSPYFTRGNIEHCTASETTNPGNPSQPGPWKWALVVLFFGICSSYIYALPHYFRYFRAFGWVHDFHAQTTGNMALFVAPYLWLVQISCQGVAIGAANACRGFLSEYLFKSTSSKKTDKDQ